MFPGLILGTTLCFLFAIWHLLRNELTRRKNKYAPGPYDFPIIGSAVQLSLTAGISGQHYEKFHRLCHKYGKTVFLRAGTMNLVFTEDFELMKEVINSSDWSNRFPSHPRFKEHTLFKNLGLMWSDGEVHHEMRKFTSRTLRTFGFGELKATQELLQTEIGNLFKQIDEERSRSSLVDEVSMHHKFKIPTFNILWKVMAGERFGYDDPRIEALILAVDDVARINIGLDPEWAFPLLRFIPGCSPSRAKRPSFVICHDFFTDLLRERRRKAAYKEVQSDFIDYFLYKIDEEKDNPSTVYTDEQFQVTCVDLLFGGLDTTANSLEFAILYMTKYPWVQERVQTEIDAVIGSNRIPGVSDRASLKYVEAVMLETFRFACIVPMNGRTANCDTRIGKYNVPKDTLCALNVTIAHQSQELWGDPEVFRPDRFLDPNNNIINSEKVLAFGGGKRQCPGYIMAKVIWISFFTSLLQRYNFSSSPEHPELSIIPDPGVANTPKKFHSMVTLRDGMEDKVA